MKIREVTDGEVQASRTRGDQKIEAFVCKTKNLSDVERFDCLQKQFDTVRMATDKALENFDLDRFIERGHADRPAEDLKALFLGAIQGVRMMECLCNEMEDIPLSKVNGTSVKFAKSAIDLGRHLERIETNKRVFETIPPQNRNPDSPPPPILMVS